MAREIDIRPLDPGLNLAAQTELRAARRGGNLEDILGLATDLTTRLDVAKRTAQRQRALSQFAGGGELTPGLPIQSVTEALGIRKALVPAVKKEDRKLPPVLSQAVTQQTDFPEPPGGFSMSEAKFAFEIKTFASKAAIGGGELGRKDKFAIVNTLGKRFEGLSKDFFKQRDSIARVRASGVKPSAAGDLALIFNFMKILDPGSVVRESEFANAETSRALLGDQGVPEFLLRARDNVVFGARLTPKQRADFLGRAEILFVKAQELQNQRRSNFEGLATSFGIDPKQVVLGPASVLRQQQAGDRRPKVRPPGPGGIPQRQPSPEQPVQQPRLQRPTRKRKAVGIPGFESNPTVIRIKKAFQNGDLTEIEALNRLKSMKKILGGFR